MTSLKLHHLEAQVPEGHSFISTSESPTADLSVTISHCLVLGPNPSLRTLLSVWLRHRPAFKEAAGTVLVVAAATKIACDLMALIAGGSA